MPIGILIVDDNIGSRILLAEAIESSRPDIRAICAASGREALDRLRAASQMPPRAVVLDLLMPGMDGRAFLRELVDHNLPTPPIVVVSGLPESLISDVRQLAHVVRVLTKPLDLRALESAIEDALATPLRSSRTAS